MEESESELRVTETAGTIVFKQKRIKAILTSQQAFFVLRALNSRHWVALCT